MSGVLGTSGGGAAGVTSVTAGNGITVTGTTTPTIAASLAAGTGVSIAGTTTLTVSATGVNSVSAGTGISVSGTTALTVSATGVNSLVAGTAISVSGTTTMTVTNTGVTALAGTGISVSAATGSVTVTPTYAAPTALTIGGTVVTGAAASVANSGHVHAMPGSAVAGASAVGDTASTGSATTVALSDHKHSREAFGTPVVVNGQTTSLATGSLTTLARADHVHTVSNVPVLIGTAVITSTTATYTFSSIPQTYTHLSLYTSANTTSAITSGWMSGQFNGDTASNYVAQGYGGTNTALSIGVTTGTTNYLSTANAECTTVIPNYSNTTRQKGHTTTYFFNDSSTATYSLAPYSTGGYWRSTAAITSIKLFPGAGSFGAGSTLSLYGWP